jgi:hypothetical protein
MLTLTKCARSEAVAQGSPCRLNIDSAAGKYWLTVQQGGEYVPLAGEMGQQFDLPEGATAVVRTDAVASDPVPTGSSTVSGPGLGIGQGLGHGLGTGLTRTPLAGPMAAAEPVYVQFYPTGRSDVATIEITDRQGRVYQVACLSATEPFRVLAPAGGAAP